MSDLIYTTEQKNAMNLRGKNLLVSASAGTGKTAVLVGRIIKMATDPENPVDLDRMLIVTFTNAASEEMKSRIRNKIFEELKKSPGDYRLRKQLILLGQANISTIHSFCSEIIRSNYHLINIDPGFGVCDDGKADGFLDEAMLNVLAYAYEENQISFIKLVDGYGRGKDDRALTDLLTKIYKKSRSLPGYRDWLTEKSANFNETYMDFGKSRWGSPIIENAKERVESYLEDIENLLDIIINDDFMIGYSDTLENDRIQLAELQITLANGSWDECREAVISIQWNRLANAKRGASDILKAIVKDTRAAYKKEISDLSGRLSGTSAQINDNMKDLSPVIACMTKLILMLDKEYTDIKNSNGVVDYNDLEHYALECLEKEAGDMYRDRFDEIFVDEYQDSNHIQERIVNLVSGRGKDLKNVFMVGDIKQSIYRFRMADPEIFSLKNKSYSNDISNDNVRIDLSDNYRSRKPVLDFINSIFKKIMSEAVGDEDYIDKVFLRPGNKEYGEGNDNGYPVEIKLVCGDSKEFFTKDITSEMKEAAVVGNEILRLINSKMIIKDKNTNEERAIKFGDIAILIRSANTVSLNYIRQLKKMGIPVYSESSSDFFGEYEIMIMEAFCRVVDNPRQDIPLIALLRSSIFGFDDRELAYIRCSLKFTDYYDSILTFTEDDNIKEKINRFIEIIEKYRKDSINRPIDRLIWDMMHETGFYYFGEEGDNHVIRQKNLRRLFEIAGTYENGRETGLSGFIEYLEQLKKIGIKDTSSSGGDIDTVTLMSIHKSKGLEFPVVFVSSCGKGFNKQELSENIVFDRELGFGPDYIDAKAGVKLTTAIKKSIKIKKEKEDLAEEMRVLYVALTRAREKLVITGYVKNPDNAFENWYIKGLSKNGRLSTGKVLMASSYMDWIMPTLINEDIKLKLESGELQIINPIDSEDTFYKIDVFYPDKINQFLNLDLKYPGTIEKSQISIDYNTIKERFGWEYPFIHEGIYHKKISVTELKKLQGVQPGERDIFKKDFIPRPEFLNDEKQDAAGRGTMLHNIIAAVNHKRVFEPGYITELCLKAGCPEELKNEYADMILNFFKSELGSRVLFHEGESEKPFLFTVPTKEIYPESTALIDNEHTTIIQGVIDNIIYENDGVVIIDFKSDNVISGNEDIHAQKYKLQLDLYGRAVEKLTGKPVKGKYIYFFKSSVYVQLN